MRVPAGGRQFRVVDDASRPPGTPRHDDRAHDASGRDNVQGNELRRNYGPPAFAACAAGYARARAGLVSLHQAFSPGTVLQRSRTRSQARRHCGRRAVEVALTDLSAALRPFWAQGGSAAARQVRPVLIDARAAWRESPARVKFARTRPRGSRRACGAPPARVCAAVAQRIAAVNLTLHHGAAREPVLCSRTKGAIAPSLARYKPAGSLRRAELRALALSRTRAAALSRTSLWRGLAQVRRPPAIVAIRPHARSRVHIERSSGCLGACDAGHACGSAAFVTSARLRTQGCHAREAATCGSVSRVRALPPVTSPVDDACAAPSVRARSPLRKWCGGRCGAPTRGVAVVQHAWTSAAARCIRAARARAPPPAAGAHDACVHPGDRRGRTRPLGESACLQQPCRKYRSSTFTSPGPTARARNAPRSCAVCAPRGKRPRSALCTPGRGPA